MKKGTHLSRHSKKLLSKSLKNYFANGGTPWNKNKKFSIRTETSAQIFRKDPNYYLNELRKNSIRSHEKVYLKNEQKILHDKQIRKEMQEKTGAGRKARKWLESEIQYLYIHYKFYSVFDMAIELNRSWISVEHKLNRLKLTTYHRWK